MLSFAIYVKHNIFKVTLNSDSCFWSTTQIIKYVILILHDVSLVYTVF